VIFGAMSILEATTRHRPMVAWTFAALALTIGPLGLIRPTLVRPVFVAWSVVAFPIGWLVSTVMLAVLFYGVFTPIGLLFRVVGRDALLLRRQSMTTYWRPKPAAQTARDYFRQS
jgi:hypothetical protein